VKQGSYNFIGHCVTYNFPLLRWMNEYLRFPNEEKLLHLKNNNDYYGEPEGSLLDQMPSKDGPPKLAKFSEAVLYSLLAKQFDRLQVSESCTIRPSA
jgi:hypothetical protein